MAVTFVTGPVRSGKSRFVVEIAKRSALPVRYVATAMRVPDDAEWEARLQRHVRDRPAAWEVVESSGLANEALVELFTGATAAQCVVVDALGTWLAARIARNVDAFERDAVSFEAQMDREGDALVRAMLASPARVVVVAEEVGWDVVPMHPSARLFRDVLGRMKQRLAAEAAEAYLVVCGYALDLKRLGAAIA